MKKVIILFIACGLVAATQAVLVDDFEGYGTGNVNVMASPPWIAIDGTGYADIESRSENHFMTWGWSESPRGAALVLEEAGVAGVSNTATTATLFFRVYVESDSVNHSIGLSDVSSEFSSFDDYEIQVIIVDNGSADGIVSIRGRNGNTATSVGELNVGQWYNVWAVINQVTDTYDLYLTTDYAGATEADRIADDFSFRYGTTDDLASIFLWCYNQGQNVRIDKISLSQDVDLSIPQETEQYSTISQTATRTKQYAALPR